MRTWLLLLCLASGSSAVAQLPEASDPATVPKNWQDDFRLIMKHGHLEPVLRETWVRMDELRNRAQKRKVTKDHRYWLYSTAWGIIGFRENNPKEPDESGTVILIGVHASKHEPPPFPFRVEPKIGGVALRAKAAPVLAAREPLYIEEETYFGEKCRAYAYGAGHWIRRIYVRNDRVIALSFGIDP